MEKNNLYLNKVENLNIEEIKSIIDALKNKNPEDLNEVDIQLISIFYAYQLQLVKIIYIMMFYNKFMPIIKSYIWIDNKYQKIKNYLFSFF